MKLILDPIGGYFELELESKKEFYPQLYRYNSASAALQVILEHRKYQRLFIPSYICESVVKGIKKIGTDIVFYSLNELLDPELDYAVIGDGDCLLYVNYFGIKSEGVKLATKLTKNIIVDNAQAFYDIPQHNTDSIYSPRKFFGVPDGGYLYTSETISKKYPRATSAHFSLHLLERSDNLLEEGYPEFQKNEKKISDMPIGHMSVLTQKLLQSINYESIKNTRLRNFLYLHKKLSKYNTLQIQLNTITCPLVYPFLTADTHLKSYLIQNKIFVPTYWPEIMYRLDKSSFDYYFVNNLLSLPIDQRYSEKHMDRISDLILEQISQA